LPFGDMIWCIPCFILVVFKEGGSVYVEGNNSEDIVRKLSVSPSQFKLEFYILFLMKLKLKSWLEGYLLIKLSLLTFDKTFFSVFN
jgi:hypothetical protein